MKHISTGSKCVCVSFSLDITKDLIVVSKTKCIVSSLILSSIERKAGYNFNSSMTNMLLPDWCRTAEIVCDNAKSPSNSLSRQCQTSLCLPTLIPMRCSTVPRKKQRRSASTSSSSCRPSKMSTVDYKNSRQPQPRRLKKSCSDSGPQIIGLVSQVGSSKRERRRSTITISVAPQQPSRKTSLVVDEEVISQFEVFKNFDVGSSDEDDEMYCAPPTLPQRQTSIVVKEDFGLDSLILKEGVEYDCYKRIIPSKFDKRRNNDSNVFSSSDEDDENFSAPPSLPQRKASLVIREDFGSDSLILKEGVAFDCYKINRRSRFEERQNNDSKDSDEDDEMFCAPPSLPQRKVSVVLKEEYGTDSLITLKEGVAFDCYKLSHLSKLDERTNTDSDDDYSDDVNDDYALPPKITLNLAYCAEPPQIPQRKISLNTIEDAKSLKSARDLIDDSDEEDDEPTIPCLQRMQRYPLSRPTTA